MRIKGFLTRTTALMASRGIQDGLGMLLLLWLARRDQSGYGLFVFSAGVASMVRAGLALGLDQYTLREFSSKEQSRAPLLGRMARIKALLGSMILAGLAAFGVFKGWSGLQITVVLIIVTGQVMEGVADTFFNLFRAEGRQVKEGLYRSVANMIGACYGVFCILSGLDIAALAFYWVISNGLKLIAAFIGVVKLKLAPAWNRRADFLLKDHVFEILTIAGVSVLGSFYNCVQIFLLKHSCPITEVAYYGAAADMAGGISGLVAHIVIGAVLFPRLTAAAARGPDHLADMARIYFWNLTVYGIGISFSLSTLGGLVLTTLYGVKYAASVTPLIIFGPAVLLSFVNNFGVFVLLALRKERQLFVFHLFPVFLSLGAGIFLVPKFGAIGGAVNLLGCRTLMLMLILGGLQHYLRLVRWPDSRHVLKALVCMAFAYLILFRIMPYGAALVSLAVYGVVNWLDVSKRIGCSWERSSYEKIA